MGEPDGLRNIAASLDLEGQTLGNADLSSALNVLPIEIWVYALQFMTFDTVLAFSTCCKLFRELAAPAVFKTILLHESSLKAFRDGSLVGSRHLVRTIIPNVYEDYLCGPADDSATAMGRLAQSASIFPGFRKLYITFAGPCSDTFQSAYLSEVFRGLSEHSGYKNLRFLELAHDFLEDVTASSTRPRSSVPAVPRLEEKEEENLKHIKPFTNIEELELQCCGALDFSDKFDGWSRAHIGLLRSSAAKLRKLELRAKEICYDSRDWEGYLETVTIRYPALKELHLTVDSAISWGTLEILVTIAPNLTYLLLDALEAPGFQAGITETAEILYPQLTRLKDLQNVLIIWPRVQVSGQAYSHITRNCWMLMAVENWARSGMEKLNHVSFIVRQQDAISPGNDGQLWVRQEGCVEIFEIARKDEDINVISVADMDNWYDKYIVGPYKRPVTGV
ncbi:hypothetical protein TWF730_011115 [Orbilia blumenaviensis]|uniref:F-box domain-containing protein n=1 Tax=Orbilia blumenaviensis TaxID=1796055 RepID=A0AAV9UMX5_9PEZI